MPTVGPFFAGTATAVAGTWSNLANSQGSTTGTFATWTDTSRRGTATWEGSGFGASIPTGTVPTSCSVYVKHFQNNLSNLPTLTVQLYVGATPTGSALSLTPSLTSTNEEGVGPINLTGLTDADIPNLRVQITGTRANVLTSTTFNLDRVYLQALGYETPAVTGSASLSADGSLTAAGSEVSSGASGSAALSADGTLSAASTVRQPASAAVSAGGSLSASAAVIQPASSAVAASGSLTASGVVLRLGAASLAASSSLTASTGGITSGSAALAASGALAASAGVRAGGTASLAAAGSLAASGSVRATGGGALAASGTFTASARLILRPDAGVTATGSLSAGASVVQLARADLAADTALLAAAVEMGALIYRPDTGPAVRPGSGSTQNQQDTRTARPFAGVTTRP